MKNSESLIGKSFGKYIVIEKAKSIKGRSMWLCKCSCGTVRSVYQHNLVRRPNGSCGCTSIERISKLNLSHGLSETPEHNIWMTMKSRCYNPNNEKYSNYGGRGIIICDQWKDNFDQFISDMGLRPTVNHSIDRKDVNGNYEPNNCRWATIQEQNRNRRNNHVIETEWGLITLAEAAERSGIGSATIRRRIKLGFTGTDLLQKPPLKKRK